MGSNRKNRSDKASSGSNQQTKGVGSTNSSSRSDTKITNNNTAEDAVALIIGVDFVYRHLLLPKHAISWVKRCSFVACSSVV